MTATAVLSRRQVGCVSDLTIDRWLLGETPGSDEARRVEAHMKSCASCASRIGALRGLYSTQVSAARHEPPVRLEAPPPQTPGQTGALQFVILRDGLLVGTEFFTPGAYLIGSDARADLQLDGVLPLHARLYFRDGRVALKAEHGALYVNGFKVDACEVRAIDEVLVGPYVLRARVLRERWGEPPAVASPPPSPPRAVVPEVTFVDPPARAPVRTRLTVELWWGDTRQEAKSFEAPVTARDFQLWGFNLADDEVLAEPTEGGQFVVHVPRVATAPARTVVLEAGSCASVTEGALRLVFSVHAALERSPSVPVLPWPTALLSAVLLAGFLGAMKLVPMPEEEPFTPRDLKRSVSLIWPTPRQKQVEPIAERRASAAHEPDARTHEPRRSTPTPPRSTVPDRFSAITKLLGGSHLKALLDNGKSPAKPVAGRSVPSLFAGLSTVSTKGLELGLHGDGTIGAAGATRAGQLTGGGVGKGPVGGLLERPRAAGISLPGDGSKGSIDKDAVAKAIAEHLAEVSACYERALIANGHAGGRLSLEWTITTAGSVSLAKVKSSTLKDASIASCVMARLKTWPFPPARGGSVVVSYPFVFQSSDF